MKGRLALAVSLLFASGVWIPTSSFITTYWAPPYRLGHARVESASLLLSGERQSDYETRKSRQRDSFRGKTQGRPSPEYQGALDSLLTHDNSAIQTASCLSTREQVNLIHELERQERYEIILELIQHRDTLQPAVMDAAVVALRQTNKYRSAALQLCKEHTLSSNTCVSLFQGLSTASDAATLMNELQSLHNAHVNTVDVWNAAIYACQRATDSNNDNWQTALGMFRDMKRRGMSPNERTYGHVLYTCAQAGQARIALSLLEEVQAKNESSPQIWGTALHACAKASSHDGLEDALSILRHMRRHGIRINVIHVSAFLSTCAKAKRDDVALELLECFRHDRDFELSSQNVTIPPVSIDLVVVNTVLLACAKAGNYNAAREILQELKQDGFAVEPDVISYNTVLSACDDPIEAKALVKEVRFGFLKYKECERNVPAHLNISLNSFRCECLDDTDTGRFLHPALLILTPFPLAERLEMWTQLASF